MEFRINKIDTDLRQKINEERSEDKIHNKKGITINKDKNSEDKNKFQENNQAEKKDKSNYEENGQKDTEKVDPDKGHYIDIRR